MVAKIPIAGIDTSRGDSTSVGIILIDSKCGFIGGSREALRILAFPEMEADRKRIESIIAVQLDASSLVRSKKPLAFRSGQRRYDCHAVPIESPLSDPSYVLLLSRAGQAQVQAEDLVERYRLTQREIETLQLLVRGYSTKKIATTLGISPNTVKVFIRMITSKLGVASRAEAVAKALRPSIRFDPAQYIALLSTFIF